MQQEEVPTDCSCVWLVLLEQLREADADHATDGLRYAATLVAANVRRVWPAEPWPKKKSSSRQGGGGNLASGPP